MAKILTCGLGDGLDIVNASLLYFAAKNEGTPVVLGSSRPAPLESIENHAPFANSGTWISRDSVINYGGRKGLARYPEPRIVWEKKAFWSSPSTAGCFFLMRRRYIH